MFRLKILGPYPGKASAVLEITPTTAAFSCAVCSVCNQAMPPLLELASDVNILFQEAQTFNAMFKRTVSGLAYHTIKLTRLADMAGHDSRTIQHRTGPER